MRKTFIFLLLAVVTVGVSAQKSIVFPDEFTSDLLNQEIIITNRMYVVETYGSRASGALTLADKMLSTPTDVVLPGTDDYQQLKADNETHRILLYSSNSLINANNTLRIGSSAVGIRGTVKMYEGKYEIIPTVLPVFTGNERTATPDAVGTTNLRVAGFNLEFFLPSPQSWGSGYGAEDAADFKRQRTKIAQALKLLNADVYALCEVEQGNYSPQYLVDMMNEVTQSTRYAYADQGDTEIKTYTKNLFIYDKTKVKAIGPCETYDGFLPQRHVAQCFQLISNNEKVIISMNHLKSKRSGGYGDNADQGDGQSYYNALRVSEANDVLTLLDEMRADYADSDVLVLGDMNAYAKEDPIRVFTDNGFVDELKKYAPEKYSYVYHGEKGNLDHALASTTLNNQVTGATIWDINASEPGFVNYSNTTYYEASPYGSSDHNPVLVGLDLGKTSGITTVSDQNAPTCIRHLSDSSYTLCGVEMESLQLYNALGQCTYQNALNGDRHELSASLLHQGVNIVRILSRGRWYTLKIMK
jgi:predicted extracellular nuclease